MAEVLNLRTKNSHTNDNGDGTFTLESFSGDIYYDDGGGNLIPVDHSIVPSDVPGYDWMNAANEFKFHVKENLNQPDAILFTRNGVQVTTQPRGIALQRTDNGNHTLYDTPGNTTCTVVGDELRFTGLYTGIEARYRSTPKGIKEYFVFDNFEAIPDPLDYGINPEVVRVAFLTELTPVGQDDITDELGSTVVEDTDVDDIRFSKNGNPEIIIPRLVAWSPAGRGPRVTYPVHKRIKNVNGKHFLLHGMKYVDMIARRTPFIVDASFSSNTNTGDIFWVWDTTGTTATLGSSTSTVLYFGRWTDGKTILSRTDWYLPFANVSIPRNSTVSAASISYYMNEVANGGDTSIRLYAHNVDNSSPPTTLAGALSLPKTATWANYTIPTSVGSKSATLQNSSLEAVFSRAGWSSGNQIGIISNTTGTPAYSLALEGGMRSFNFGSTVPSISITYTEPVEWGETINGQTSYTHINGIAVANIDSVNGI